MQNILFYKGEDIELTFTATVPIDAYTKSVKYFTPYSAIKTASITPINSTTFKASMSAADTADLTPGKLNIVLEFSIGSGKIISKSIDCKIADAYLDGNVRTDSTNNTDIIFLNNQLSITVNFLSSASQGGGGGSTKVKLNGTVITLDVDGYADVEAVRLIDLTIDNVAYLDGMLSPCSGGITLSNGTLFGDSSFFLEISHGSKSNPTMSIQQKVITNSGAHYIRVYSATPSGGSWGAWKQVNSDSTVKQADYDIANVAALDNMINPFMGGVTLNSGSFAGYTAFSLTVVNSGVQSATGKIQQIITLDNGERFTRTYSYTPSTNSWSNWDSSSYLSLVSAYTNSTGATISPSLAFRLNKYDSNYASGNTVSISGFTNLPIYDCERTIVIKNSKASSVTYIPSTSDVVSNGITYSFLLMNISTITVPTGKRVEFNYLFTFTSATTCVVTILFSIQP